MSCVVFLLASSECVKCNQIVNSSLIIVESKTTVNVGHFGPNHSNLCVTKRVVCVSLLLDALGNVLRDLGGFG